MIPNVLQQDTDISILLQNENGPCPLLAAANALLLRGTIQLPAHSIASGEVTLQELTNILANQALQYDTDGHYVQEVLDHIPRFEHGMDVNPRFTAGITGYENTSELTSFDMLQVTIVHGWLVDPQEEQTYDAIGNRTYNELVELVIQGADAESECEKLAEKIKEKEENLATSQEELDALREEYKKLSQKATEASLIRYFLDNTSHQLTAYGLQVLYDEIKENDLYVLFRNNHYSTLTKQGGVLYNLVTDYGYANNYNVIWEKLDVIDGDTEFVNAQFHKVPNHVENDHDMQVALQLSMQEDNPETEDEMIAKATQASLHDAESTTKSDTAAQGSYDAATPEDADRMLAMQLQDEGDSEDPSLQLAQQLQDEENRRISSQRQDEASLHLARQLQEEENQRAAAQASARERQPTPTNQRNRTKVSNCVIS